MTKPADGTFLYSYIAVFEDHSVHGTPIYSILAH